MTTYGTDPRPHAGHHTDELVIARCKCIDDHDLDRLGALMADGVDQWSASRMIWGAGTGSEFDVVAYVRDEFRRAFGWLRLPERAA